MVTPRGSETAKLMTQLVRWTSHGLLDAVFAECQAGGGGISEAQFEVLRYIDCHTAPTIGAVADSLHISSAAATKMVKTLADRPTPLVTRARGEDRRTVHLCTTRAGRAVVDGIRRAYTSRLDEVIGRLDDEDRAALERGVGAFLESVLASPDDADAACLRCGVDSSPDCLVRLAELAFDRPSPLKC